MKAIKVETTIDEAAATAIPALRPMLGRRVELIVLQSEAEQPATPKRRLTVDELLALRLDLPPGVAPVSLEDMEQAIAAGATDRGSL